MAKNRQQKARELKKLKAQKEREQVAWMHSRAPYIKQICRHRGCDLPFYDYLDSYEEEFNRIAASGMKQFPSILGIHELDGKSSDKEWADLGYGNLTRIDWDMGEEYSDYGQHSDAETFNMDGFVTAFLTDSGESRMAIRIRRDIQLPTLQNKEFKYGVKIATLLHELGHVEDIERRETGNFNLETRRANIIEAEVFAHLKCLEGLAHRCMAPTYGDLVTTLQKVAANGSGYLQEVATKVVERLPARTIEQWQPVFHAMPPTREELKMIGRAGEAILSGRQV